MSQENANADVREYWDKVACGTEKSVVSELPEMSREWFARVEEYRYEMEPFIHSFAQFTRYHGKDLLEVGVGAGTDHLQWARAGARCNGVDLTQRGIDTTTAHLALHGFTSNLQRIDAEILPFPDASFDVVYSWGVIHHSDQPERILEEIRRVLRPGGQFIGMLYGRRSLVAIKLWLQHGLLKGRPGRSLADVVAQHMESPGTKAYTVHEIKHLFRNFINASTQPIVTPYDLRKIPRGLHGLMPIRAGWFIMIRARR